MLHIPSKSEWQLIVDFTFIRNCMPENTPVRFLRTHTKGFLHMLHPNLDIDDDMVTRMTSSSSQHPIDDLNTKAAKIAYPYCEKMVLLWNEGTKIMSLFEFALGRYWVDVG